MKFIDYYKSIPENEDKREVRNKILNSCDVQQSTFYTWFRRCKFPKWAQKKISEIVNKPQAELFAE